MREKCERIVSDDSLMGRFAILICFACIVESPPFAAKWSRSWEEFGYRRVISERATTDECTGEGNELEEVEYAQDVTGEDSYEGPSLLLCTMQLGDGDDFLPNEVRRVVGQARVTTGSLPGNPQKATAMH